MIKPDVFPDSYICHCFECGQCICGADERALRHYAYGSTAPLPSMTLEQRQWCISEAVQSGEGSIRTEVISDYPDKELAGEVLRAWTF